MEPVKGKQAARGVRMEIFWGDNKKPGDPSADCHAEGETVANTGDGTTRGSNPSTLGATRSPVPLVEDDVSLTRGLARTTVLTDSDLRTDVGQSIQDMRHTFITEAANCETKLRTTSNRCLEQLETITARHQQHMDAVVAKHHGEIEVRRKVLGDLQARLEGEQEQEASLRVRAADARKKREMLEQEFQRRNRTGGNPPRQARQAP